MSGPRSVSGVSGDLRLDAFATRLANFDGSRASLEGDPEPGG